MMNQIPIGFIPGSPFSESVDLPSMQGGAGMNIVVNFSGGKDSSAMLAWICEHFPAANLYVVMADTGWEHPDAIEWSRKIVAMFGLDLIVVRSETKTFLTMAEKRGMFPGPNTRQCTSDLKRDPIHKWIRQNFKSGHVYSAMGLRAEESPNRAKMKPSRIIAKITTATRTVHEWLPIHDWSEPRIHAYLIEKGIPLHPVYKHLKRFSCRICIYMTQEDRRQVAIHDPEAIKIIHTIEKKIGFTMFMDGPIKDENK